MGEQCQGFLIKIPWQVRNLLQVQTHYNQGLRAKIRHVLLLAIVVSCLTISALLCSNGREMATPEELEQIRAYGQALLGASQVPQEQPVRVGEYGAVSPFSILTRGLQAMQGRSALNRVEAGRQDISRQRAASVPGVGTATPPPVTPPAAPTATTPPVAPTASPMRTGSLHPRFVDVLANLESSNDPNVSTANGRRVPENQATYFGLGQFSRDLLRKLGVTNWRDPVQQRRAIAQHAEENAQAFRQRFNRDPNPGELYLLHQQGVGGGIALLSSPDRSAFDVLMELPFYGRNAGRVRSAIENNLPQNLRGKWRDMTAGEFANQWVSRFNSSIGPDAVAPQSTVAATDGRMNLGGPSGAPNAENLATPAAAPSTTGSIPPEAGPPSPIPTENVTPGTTLTSGEPPPTSLAQANTGAGANVQLAAAPRAGEPPQSIPPNPQLQMIIQQLRNPTILSSEQFNELLKQYQTLAAPQSIKYPFGTATYNPLDGKLMNFVPELQQRQVQVPGVTTTIPQIYEGGELRTIPQAGPGGSAAPPVGGAPPTGQPPAGGAPGPQGGLPNPNISPQFPPFPQSGSISDMAAWGQRTQAAGGIAQELGRGQAARVTRAMTQGIQATERIQMLNTIRTATNAAANSRWVGESLSRFQDQASTFLYNFDPNNSQTRQELKDLPYRELLGKLNAFLASEATQEISARGTNFEFATLLRYNPNLMATHEGTMMLVDYLRQEKEKQEKLGDVASNLRPEQVGDWNRIVREYYEKNPIYINVPAAFGRPAMRVTTRNIPRVGDPNPNGGAYSADDVRGILNSLPEGVWYINPNNGQPTARAPASRTPTPGAK